MYEEVTRELVVARPDGDDYVVRMAMTGFLAGCSGLTRDAYALDLRQFHGWCASHGLGMFAVRRTHIELFAAGWSRRGRRKRRWRGGCRRSACSTGSANRSS